MITRNVYFIVGVFSVKDVAPTDDNAFAGAVFLGN